VTRLARLALVASVVSWFGACRSQQAAPSSPDPGQPVDAGADTATAPLPVDAAPIVHAPPRWLRGSTHVHASPSGDSSTRPDAVMAWYRAHDYDFIVLTDHNRVTVPTGVDPGGRAVAAPVDGLLVIGGIELTFNPGACADPAPAPGGKCRIHVNGLGVTARPAGRLEWADRATRDRRAMYQAALREIATLGGIAQLNHPQWHWGMTSELLIALAGDGVGLVEIANSAFAIWDAGDATHPSVEQLWDEALQRGARLWAVASDDAHSYDPPGKYPAGGGWVMVDAPLDAAAIVDALARGRFYASTGVALDWAGAVDGELVVGLAPEATGPHTIAFIVDGAVVSTTRERAARFAIPAGGYVRAVVTREADGARAWVQPARR